jgi:hypothetical protein
MPGNLLYHHIPDNDIVLRMLTTWIPGLILPLPLTRPFRELRGRCAPTAQPCAPQTHSVCELGWYVESAASTYLRSAEPSSAGGVPTAMNTAIPQLLYLLFVGIHTHNRIAEVCQASSRHQPDIPRTNDRNLYHEILLQSGILNILDSIQLNGAREHRNRAGHGLVKGLTRRHGGTKITKEVQFNNSSLWPS